MRNFGAPAYNGPVESVKSMLPEWLTWKTAILIYGVRAAAGFVIFREARNRFEAQGSSARTAKAKAAGTAAVLSTVVALPVGYVIATRAEKETEMA